MVANKARITMIKARIIGRIERFRSMAVVMQAIIKSMAVVMQAIMVVVGTVTRYCSRPRKMMATTCP